LCRYRRVCADLQGGHGPNHPVAIRNFRKDYFSETGAETKDGSKQKTDKTKNFHRGQTIIES